MADKISAVHGTQGSATRQYQELSDPAGKLSQLHELLSANNRQKEAEAAAMEELQAEMRSDPDLMTIVAKSMWDGRPGLLIMALRQRSMKERDAQRDEAHKLRQAEVAIAQETAAKESLNEQLQEARGVIAQGMVTKESYNVKLEVMEACLAAEKAKSAEAESGMKKFQELSSRFQERLHEQHSKFQLAQESRHFMEQQVSTLQASLATAKDGQRAAQEQFDSLQAQLQALAAAERTAVLLAEDLEGKHKAATKELRSATAPLKQRVATLESKGKLRATTIEALKQQVTLAQENEDAARAAEQAANAAAAKAQADVQEHMDALLTKHTAEVAALKAELEEARSAHASSMTLQNETATETDISSAVHSAMDSGSKAMEQEDRPAGSAEQPSVEGADVSVAEVSVAEQGSSEQACCELCEQGGHNKEDCPLVVAAQESESTSEGEETKEAEWQVVAGKASKSQGKGNKGTKAGKGNKVGKGTQGGNGNKEQGKEKKVGDTAMVITVHRDASNGWVPVTTPLSSRVGSSANQPGSQ